jgi:hypothetical protein
MEHRWNETDRGKPKYSGENPVPVPQSRALDKLTAFQLVKNFFRVHISQPLNSILSQINSVQNLLL